MTCWRRRRGARLANGVASSRSGSFIAGRLTEARRAPQLELQLSTTAFEASADGGLDRRESVDRRPGVRRRIRLGARVLVRGGSLGFCPSVGWRRQPPAPLCPI